MTYRLEQYSIADYLRFNRDKRLTLNADFQRRDVWKLPTQVYFIDTILSGMSIPKIYLRTKIDPKTQDIVRDVVDGQQRLRTIIKFASNELRLSSKSPLFAGKRYSDLTEDEQTRFLTYVIATEHLINADDDYVVKIFARLNQYGVKLNNAEIRNAQFSGEFKMSVVDFSQQWSTLYGKLGILSINDRTRMLDDELTAEMFQIIINGIQAGTDSALKRIYKDKDKIYPDKDTVFIRAEAVLQFIRDHLSADIGPPIFNRPHFILLFSAIAYVMFGFDITNITNDEDIKTPIVEAALPKDDNEKDVLIERLQRMGEIILDSEAPEGVWNSFYYASRGATINEKSRRTRFPFYIMALSAYDEDIFK